MVLNNLEVHVKGLHDTTALGDRCNHAYGRMVTSVDCGGMLHVTMVRLTVLHSTYIRSHGGNVDMEGVKYDRPAGWREQ